VFIFVVIVLTIVIIFATFVYMIGVKSQKPKRRKIEHLPNMPYEEVSWKSSGQTIKGWFIPPAHTEANGPPPVIIIAHGWNSNRSSMLRYINRLHPEGYALLVGDARSHGESEATRVPSGITMCDDIEAALDYISSRTDIDPQRIGVLGHSLGGFGSVLALGRGDKRIRALVTDAMPARVETMIAAELTRRKLPLFPLVQLIPLVWSLRSGITKEQFNIVRAIDATTTPLLMIHSRNDHFIPVTEHEYVISHIRREVEQLYLDCDGHSSSAGDPAFWQRVLPFFKVYLVNKS
jgi:dipeptidyl aminopeptidase/acylaminoacyl peptidase